jgi:hypothetical protein
MQRFHCALFVLASLASTLLAGASPWAQEWDDITPSSGSAPAPRALASAVFDTQGDRMVIFGGQADTGPLNDVWSFDLDDRVWIDVTPSTGPAPAPRFTPASIYDPITHTMLTWSGQGSGGAFFNDVWSFDLTTKTWTERIPTGGPPNVRYGVGAVFDPVGRDLVTFAGFTDLGRFDDVWRFNADADTWTDVSPATRPLKRCLLTASYDSKNHQMIMYGGQNAGALDDIWAFDLDLDTWTDLTPPTRPAGRWFATSAYDSANHRVTMFGGNTNGTKNNEAWIFDLTTNAWHLLTPGGTPPSARDGSAAIYDGALDRLVIFGGQDTSRRNDVWELGYLSDTATGIVPPPSAPSLALHPNVPNPFNPSTVIPFELEHAGRVLLRVYDVRGSLVRTLLDERRPAGPGSSLWDGRDDRGRRVSSGVYVCRLSSGGRTATQKLVLVK